MELGRRYLDILTQSALVLNLDQVDTTAFIAAIEDLNERREVVDHDVAALRRELEAIQQQNDRARHELDHITHVHHSMRLMAEEREITENSLMFQHWARDYDEKEMLYRDEIAKCNAVLASRRFPLDESLEHHTLVNLAQQCAKLEAENKLLQDQLDETISLPSDVQEARLALEQAEMELQQLEELLSSATSAR
ncbi:unnamed protein product [Aphanomyces euteiches]|uniref:Uncharacterized protein n=1 Tax=Aphanomyces euteiches TaxID=100861 RepID=A0A6G0XM77_9STRA|nr:hypothetical protein Ae201684_003168 [Aphanomyces euteiches]